MGVASVSPRRPRQPRRGEPREAGLIRAVGQRPGRLWGAGKAAVPAGDKALGKAAALAIVMECESAGLCVRIERTWWLWVGGGGSWCEGRVGSRMEAPGRREPGLSGNEWRAVQAPSDCSGRTDWPACARVCLFRIPSRLGPGHRCSTAPSLSWCPHCLSVLRPRAAGAAGGGGCSRPRGSVAHCWRPNGEPLFPGLLESANSLGQLGFFATSTLAKLMVQFSRMKLWLW